jgi:hypothetical protein
MKFPQDYLKLINVTSSCYGYWRYIGKPSLTDWSLDNTIHLLHAGEENLFTQEYHIPYKCFIILNESPLERCLRHLKTTSTTNCNGRLQVMRSECL